MPAYRDKRTGRWRYRKWVKTPDGRTIRITGTPTTDTKRAAESAERTHILRVENPSIATAATDTNKEVPTVREYSEVYYEHQAGSDKPSTRASKRQILDAYVLDWFGDHRLDEIIQADVDAFRAVILDGRSRKTANNITTVLGSLLRYAARNRVIGPVDLSFVVKADSPELVALSSMQVNALTKAAEPRYRAAILLGADAGLRVGEIRALRWGDIDELKRELNVVRALDTRGNMGSTKNRGRRTVPITPRLRDALQATAKLGETIVANLTTGEPLSYWAVRDRIIAIYAAAEVTKPAEPWHVLRHTFCSELAARGVPVHIIRELAGHQDIKTTMRYMHTTAEAKRSAIDLLPTEVRQHTGNRAKPKKKKPPKP